MIGSQADREALTRGMRIDAQRELAHLEATLAAQRTPVAPAQRTLLDQLSLQVKRHAEGQL